MSELHQEDLACNNSSPKEYLGGQRALLGAVFLLALFLFVLWGPWGGSHDVDRPLILIPSPEGTLLVGEPIQPIPSHVSHTPLKDALGQRLFQDRRLSRQGRYACVDCHPLDLPQTQSPAELADAALSASSLFNLRFNIAYFHDGRAKTLLGVLNDVEHVELAQLRDWDQILGSLQQSPAYRQSFEAIYSRQLSVDQIQEVFVLFLASNMDSNNRFDRYLLGDMAALNKQEIRGYRLFKEYGCASCHQGANVGGNLFQVFGVMSDYVSSSSVGDERGAIAQNIAHPVFRVPGLRRVAETGPYFHNGAVKSLGDAVQLMATLQLGRNIPDRDVVDIVKFLRCLGGSTDEEAR